MCKGLEIISILTNYLPFIACIAIFLYSPLILSQQFHGSAPRSVLTFSIVQLPDKAVLTSRTEHGSRNPVPSVQGSDQGATSSSAPVLGVQRGFKLWEQPNASLGVYSPAASLP